MATMTTREAVHALLDQVPDDEIARLSGWLTVSGLLLTAEIVLWTLSLVG